MEICSKIESDNGELSDNYTRKKRTVDRPRRILSLADRISVIKEFDEKKGMRALANHFKCSLTQIKNIIRRRKEYLEQWENQGNYLEIRRRQSACFMSVGAVICEWAQRCRSHEFKFTDYHLCLKGRQAAVLLNATEVRTTKYWIERLKEKFKIFEPAPDTSTNKSLKISDIIYDLLPSFSPSDPMPQIIDHMIISKYTNESKKRSTNGDINENEDNLTGQSSQSSPSEELSCRSYNNAEQIICDEYDGSFIVKEEEVLTEVVLPNENDDKSEVTIKTEIVENVTDPNAKEVHSYEEALSCLRGLEQFVLLQENSRAIGLVNQLENIFKQELNK